MYILYIYIYVNDTYVNKYVGKRGHEFAGQQGKAYGGFGLRKGKCNKLYLESQNYIKVYKIYKLSVIIFNCFRNIYIYTTIFIYFI